MAFDQKHIITSYGYMLGLVGLIALAIGISDSTPPVVAEAESTPPQIIQENTLALEAKSAVVYDLSSGKFLYEKNPELQLPLASITKLMTAYVAANASSTLVVHIPKEALHEEGDSGLFANEKWNLGDLISFTLVTSSNDGAAAIASALGSRSSFVDTMNETARKLGLVQTYFLNPTGLDVSKEESGGYSSARDVASLLSHIVQERPDIIEKTRLESLSLKSLSGFTHEAHNTNTDIENEFAVIASKTGFTDLAGGNLALAFDAGPNHPMVAVVLGSSAEGRFSDMRMLMHAALSFVSTQKE